MKKPHHCKPRRPHNARQLRATRREGVAAGSAQAEGYMARVLAAALSGVIVKPGTVTVVTVAHDSWCSQHTGGVCNCRPDVTALDASGRRHVIEPSGDVSSQRTN